MQTDLTTDSREVHAGLVLGRYELLTPIAAGGMAQVWAARLKGARQFQKIVAVKTMLPKLSEDPQFEQMFLDEASLASQVRHPNAVEIMDLGEAHGILYLVMEWIEGVPLNHLMKAAKLRGGIPMPIAARIALQACAGLHAAHELHDEKGRAVGLVHRDVSPQNILVTYDGVTKVVDFGVAKATAIGSSTVTQAGQVKGKVSYMAPEQVNGEGLDRRADVFALGIVLYALTTGKHPFRRESEAATMYNICSKDPVVSPSDVIEGYPKEIELILLKALQKNRDLRFSSCDAMLRALDSLPTHLRVGSDADVAHFVRDLMGERRLDQKRRIDEAIARAEASPSGAWAGLELTSSGSRASVTTTHDLSGIASKQVLRNRILGAAGMVALAISGGLLAAILLSQGRESEPDIRVIEIPQTTATLTQSSHALKPATPAETQPNAGASTPGDEVNLADLPESADLPENTDDQGTERMDRASGKEQHSNGPRAAAPPEPVRASPKVQPKPSNSWKYDAGF